MLGMLLATLDTEEEKIKLTDIYEKYKPVILRYALSVTKNKEMAEDAVQNAFLTIIKQKEKYFSLSCRDLRILIVIITKSRCIDLLRQRNMLADVQIDEMADILPSDDTPVEERLLLHEEYEAIRKHLSALDETSRLVLEMKYLLNMSYKEIGEQLGVTPKHVDTRLMRAKEKVRKLVEKGGEPFGY